MGTSKETSVSRAISLTYKILDDESPSVLTYYKIDFLSSRSRNKN